MFRLQYRNMGNYEVLVGNLVTDVDGSDHGGIRWFELRKTGAANWSLFQEGTYAPDANHRWMGAISMDGSGNIAVGYNVSHDTDVYPSLRYVGRLASDPVGTMPQGEYILVDGSSPNGSNRYGDYSAMSVDPADDCTFWFTGMYNVSSSWSTRIGAFKFDTCSGTLGPDFSLSATPASQAVCATDEAVFNLELDYLSGFDKEVTLSALSAPTGYSAAIAPNPIMTPTTDSVLTFTHIGGAVYGSYNIDVIGVAVPTPTHTTTVGLSVYTETPGGNTLWTPANGALNQATKPVFTWDTATQADSYTIEIATDSGFSNIVASAVVDGTSYTPELDLNTNTHYFWRVKAENPCGESSYSATWEFTTAAAPGDCGLGTLPIQLYSEDFESGSAGWTHNGTQDTWALSGANVHSGSFAYFGQDLASVSDQRLLSPLAGVALPVGQSPLTLQFWNYQELEDTGGGCFDGGLLEISTDGGGSWSQLPTGNMLTDPYDGPVDDGYSNPLADLDAWCGDPQDWLKSVVDLDAYAGETVSFRFRLGTDSTVGREGWYVDDVVVQSCIPAGYAYSFGPDSLIDTAPESSVTHSFTLQNLGLADSFTLTLTSGSWATTLLTASPIAVGTGSSTQVQVQVEVPAVEASDIFTITAQSVQSPTEITTATGTTTAAILTGLSLTPGTQAHTGSPGDKLTHTFTVKNNGNYTDTFDLAISGETWTTTGPGSVGPLGAGASQAVAVEVTIPNEPAVADVIIASDSFTLEATSQQDGGTNAAATGTSHANVSPGVLLSPASQTRSGDPGAVVQHSFTLTNTGDYSDTFSLALSGYDWPTSGPASSGELGPGETFSFEVAVTLATSLPPMDDSFTLTAVSGLENGVTAQAGGTSQVDIHPGVQLPGEMPDGVGLPGTVVAHTVMITNTGDYTDTFKLTLKDHTWTTHGPANSGALGPGEHVEIEVQVHIPTFETTRMVMGEDSFTLVARSGWNSSIKTSVVGHTTAEMNPGVALSPATQSHTGLPGGVVTHTLLITNTGDYSDTFLLDITGNDWGAVGPDEVGPLGAGEYTEVLVWVVIPSDPLGVQAVIASDAFTLTATSSLSASVQAQAVGMTHAGVNPGVSITPLMQTGEGEPLMQVSYVFTVTNTGDHSDEFDLAVASSWAAELSAAATGELQPEESFVFTLRVTVPEGASNGELALATVTATSRWDGDVKAMATAETSAFAEYFIFLPILTE